MVSDDDFADLLMAVECILRETQFVIEIVKDNSELYEEDEEELGRRIDNLEGHTTEMLRPLIEKYIPTPEIDPETETELEPKPERHKNPTKDIRLITDEDDDEYRN